MLANPDRLGYSTTTPIQRAALPLHRRQPTSRRQKRAAATAAFRPLLAKLDVGAPRCAGAGALAPTRELAEQVTRSCGAWPGRRQRQDPHALAGGDDAAQRTNMSMVRISPWAHQDASWTCWIAVTIWAGRREYAGARRGGPHAGHGFAMTSPMSPGACRRSGKRCCSRRPTRRRRVLAGAVLQNPQRVTVRRSTARQDRQQFTNHDAERLDTVSNCCAHRPVSWRPRTNAAAVIW